MILVREMLHGEAVRDRLLVPWIGELRGVRLTCFAAGLRSEHVLDVGTRLAEAHFGDELGGVPAVAVGPPQRGLAIAGVVRGHRLRHGAAEALEQLVEVGGAELDRDRRVGEILG